MSHYLLLSTDIDLSLIFRKIYRLPFLSAEIKVYLNKLRWPVGLQNLLIDGVKNVPSKFFVCDDSGSMMNIDGRRLVRTGDSYK